LDDEFAFDALPPIPFYLFLNYGLVVQIDRKQGTLLLICPTYCPGLSQKRNLGHQKRNLGHQKPRMAESEAKFKARKTRKNLARALS
jgi:hypothetical protein